MTERFNLHSLVRQILRRGDAGVDPLVVAKTVMREIPPQAYGEALAQALCIIVARALVQQRADTSIVMAPPDLAGFTSEQGGADKPGVPERAPRRVHRAYNQKAYAEHWRKALDGSELVAGARKRLGQCTSADLAWLENDRHARAAEHAAKGERYGYLRHLVDQHGVEDLDCLPEDVLAATFQPRSHQANGEAA